MTRQTDDFDLYLHQQRTARRVTPQQFWPEFAWTLGRFVALAAALTALARFAPYLRHFIGAA